VPAMPAQCFSLLLLLFGSCFGVPLPVRRRLSGSYQTVSDGGSCPAGWTEPSRQHCESIASELGITFVNRFSPSEELSGCVEIDSVAGVPVLHYIQSVFTHSPHLGCAPPGPSAPVRHLSVTDTPSHRHTVTPSHRHTVTLPHAQTRSHDPEVERLR